MELVQNRLSTVMRALDKQLEQCGYWDHWWVQSATWKVRINEPESKNGFFSITRLNLRLPLRVWIWNERGHNNQGDKGQDQLYTVHFQPET